MGNNHSRQYNSVARSHQQIWGIYLRAYFFCPETKYNLSTFFTVPLDISCMSFGEHFLPPELISNFIIGCDSAAMLNLIGYSVINVVNKSELGTSSSNPTPECRSTRNGATAGEMSVGVKGLNIVRWPTLMFETKRRYVSQFKIPNKLKKACRPRPFAITVKLLPLLLSMTIQCFK